MKKQNDNSTPLEDVPDIDFRPLRHAVFFTEAIALFNSIVFAALIFGLGFIFGYGAGQEAGPTTYPTAEQLQQMEQQKGE